MRVRRLSIPDGRAWLRVAGATWENPLDPSYAKHRGGRWNPPESFPVLYLNGDVATARRQIDRMLTGSPLTADDLDDDAYVLIAAILPRAQQCVDAVTDAGLRALGLPVTYPRDADGAEIERTTCQSLGQRLRRQSVQGMWCRSACTADGRGRELGWFPASRRSVAQMVWSKPLPFHAWRYASSWTELGLPDQHDPSPRSA